MVIDKDWLFSAEDNICGLRAAGLLLRDNKLLVQRDAGGCEYALPGGHIKIGETLETGLIREFREETGADVKVKRLLWSEECFWDWGGKQAHNIAFYFLLEECSDSSIPDTGGFVPHGDNAAVLLGWLDISELQNVTLYPEFLKSEIGCLNGPIKHFISK